MHYNTFTITLKEASTSENIIEAFKQTLEKKCPDVYKKWQEKKFDIDHIFTLSFGSKEYKVTLLFAAILCNNESMVTSLLRSGADPNVVCNRYIDITPLSLAIDKNYTGIVSALLKSDKINANEKGDFGLTPLRRAIEKNNANNADIVDVLIEKIGGINTTDHNGRSPLHLASQSGKKDLVNALIAKEADVNAQDNYGNTPLHLAARNNHKDVADVLIAAKGIDVNAKDNDGNTPLHLAARNDHKDVADALIAAKEIDVNAKDSLGLTPLRLAVKHGNIRVEQTLLANGANPLSEDRVGKTRINLAKDGNIGKFLKEAKMPVRDGEANPLLESNKDKTPEKEQSKKAIDSSKGNGKKKQSEGLATIKGSTVGPASQSSTSFFSEHKWGIGMTVADFAISIFVGAVVGSITSLNIGIAVGLGCLIIGAITCGASYMLLKPKSEVTVEQTPVEKIASEGKTIAQPA